MSGEESTEPEGDEPLDEDAEGIQALAEQDAAFESPININISKTVAIHLPELEWHNMEVMPKRLKITNTGHTLIVSLKYYKERPYLSGGPLDGKYVFSQLHFHWGKNDMEGSEHTFDGMRFPLEMHVVTFKSVYLTQESALKQKDGIAALVYVFKLQEADNPEFQNIVKNLREIMYAGTSLKIDPMPLGSMVKKFVDDYFMYWGSVTTSVCVHYILWLLGRVPIGVSLEQTDSLRYLLDEDDRPIRGNFRELQIPERAVYHVNPSKLKLATILPLTQIGKRKA